MIPYGRQEITDADIAAVVDTLRSDFLTQGPLVPQFEQTVAKYCGAKHAVTANSATSALHIACRALELGQGDWLWTSPITFVASANCGLYCGARVDFVDIDPDTYNMCPKALERKLLKAEEVGRLPKVVIPVHLGGQSCDMQAIHELSQRYGFKIIEDASHAIGGKYKDQPVGNCLFSNITVFSFHPVKIITTAEGGIALTNDPELAEQMALFRSHGITRDPERMMRVTGPWYYEQIDLGYNYRMNDLQAALGVSQMTRLDEYVTRRHAIAQRYAELLADLPITRPGNLSDSYSAVHLYVIRLQLDKIKRSHREVFESMRADGIGINLHYIPVHTQPYYQGLGFRSGDFPEAERYCTEAISLPMYPTLSTGEQDSVLHALKAGLNI